jgi:hypothetical protein
MKQVKAGRGTGDDDHREKKETTPCTTSSLFFYDGERPNNLLVETNCFDR